MCVNFTPRLPGDSCVRLAGFRAASEFCGVVVKESRGCKDASISDSYLILAFPDRLESWDLQKEEKTPSWSMEIKAESSGNEYPSLLRQQRSKYFGEDKGDNACFSASRFPLESTSGPPRLHSHKTALLPLLISTSESQEPCAEC